MLPFPTTGYGTGDKCEGTIGIISGSGPDAGIDLWSKLLHTRRRSLGEAYRGDLDAPSVRVISLPLLGLSMDMARYGEDLWPILRDAAMDLAKTCSVYTIACNTLHYFASRLREINGGAFISVQEVVRKKLDSLSAGGFALLGASPVLSLDGWSPYRELTSSFEIERGNPKEIDGLIYAIKQNGRATPEIEAQYGCIVEKLTSSIVVLGCTELPLIPLPRTGHVFLDVTELLAHELLLRVESPTETHVVSI